MRIGQAELFALIKADAARQAGEQREHKFREALRLLAARIPARGDTVDIVIAEPPAKPARAIQHGGFLDRAADHRGAEGRFHDAERIGHMQFGIAGQIGDTAQRPDLARHLADRDAIRKAIGEAADAAHQRLAGRLAHIVDMALQPERIPRRRRRRRIRRIVAQRVIVQHEIDGIETETVNAALQPEFGVGEMRFQHALIRQIELGLIRQEMVQIILPPRRLPFPCRAAERRKPIIGRPAIGARIGPDEPIRLVIIAAQRGFPRTRDARSRCGPRPDRSEP